VADEKRVTHLVLSLDLSLAEQKAPAAAAATTAFAGLGLLRRTCEEPAVSPASTTRRREDWRAVVDPVAEEDPRYLRNGLLQRTCESKDAYVEEDEEQYMDSEEEQELIGNQLPQEEVARAFLMCSLCVLSIRLLLLMCSLNRWHVHSKRTSPSSIRDVGCTTTTTMTMTTTRFVNLATPS
jgi:hypothetical protein